jgi:hypothetical protein
MLLATRRASSIVSTLAVSALAFVSQLAKWEHLPARMVQQHSQPRDEPRTGWLGSAPSTWNQCRAALTLPF